MESSIDTNINNINNINYSYDRSIIKNIIIYLKTHKLQKALTLMYENVQNEYIIKAIHDYLLGVNCRYPFIRFDQSIRECGIYNIIMSKLDFEMFDSSTQMSNCPCNSLVCTNWKYFSRPYKEVFTFAPMEFFTNEYFQQGFMEKFTFCSHHK